MLYVDGELVKTMAIVDGGGKTTTTRGKTTYVVECDF